MTTPTTTTRKPRATKANPEVAEVIESTETVETTKVVEQPKIEVVEKRVLKDTDKITIMNNTTGRYMYKSKDNRTTIEMEEYGNTATLTFDELRIMFNSQRKHISEAFIIILDEDVIEEFNYTPQYKNILAPEEVVELLNKPEAIKEVLPKMPKTMREIVIYTAKRKFKNGELTDITIAKAIKEASKVDILE